MGDCLLGVQDSSTKVSTEGGPKRMYGFEVIEAHDSKAERPMLFLAPTPADREGWMKAMVVRKPATSAPAQKDPPPGRGGGGGGGGAYAPCEQTHGAVRSEVFDVETIEDADLPRLAAIMRDQACACARAAVQLRVPCVTHASVSLPVRGARADQGDDSIRCDGADGLQRCLPWEGRGGVPRVRGGSVELQGG